MTEIEKVKGEIKVLEKKLALLEEIEKHNAKPKTIRSIIDRWWMDTFTTHSKWDAEECMDDLADQIEFFYMRTNPIEELKEGTAPPEPTPSAFRQKLFDGIESIFYGTEYQKTLWRVKVDMAVDEVLTHFYDILPEPEEYIGEYGPSQGYVDGWNHYDEIIKENLEK
jgi:hypothetical protein